MPGLIGQRVIVGQGDIIHKPAKGEEKARWGFILTADCDIARDKAGAVFSYLNVVTMGEYLEHTWPSEVLRQLRTKFLDDATVLCNGAIRALGNKLDELSPEEMLTWLTDTPRAKIVSLLELTSKKHAICLETLEKVELVFGIRDQSVNALQKLYRVWAIQKTSDKEMRERLFQALDYNKATDFHLIPEIPGSDPLGYVVLLREINSIPDINVFQSQLDLKISGNEEGYYVATHSTDNLRYAISQKMAFLFSRIGMSEDYESQCKAATQLAVEEIHTSSKEMGFPE